MTADFLMDQPAARAIGWALLHFVWQGALVGAIAAVVLRMLRSSAADIRYVVSTIALALMITMPVVTAMQAWASATRGESGGTVAYTTVPAIDTHPGAPLLATTRINAAPDEARSLAGRPSFEARDLEPWLPLMLLGWCCGVALLTLRLATGWLWVQRMKSLGIVPAAPAIERAVSRLSRRLHLHRQVALFESTTIDVPTVIGWIRPVVLMPTSALAGLTPQQLEAILAHELAHVRRHDYLVNLLQTLVETLLFYHPAVWWLSRRIRMEREHCCDDIAVSLCGDPYTYARALADLEQLRGAGSQLVMAATGGSLLQRVRRLLGAPSHAGREPGWLAGVASILVMTAVVAGVATADSSATASPAQGEAPQLAAATGMDEEQAPPAPPAPPVPPAPPAPPAPHGAAMPPAPPAPPVPPAPPAVPEPPAMSQDSGTFTWSHNGEKVQLKYSGELVFTDDDRDVKRLSPGGYLRISDGGWFGARVVEFRADQGGTIQRRFWKGSSERPFEPEGRQWLADVLPRFIRQSGLGAEARVARILEAKGPDGVLAEIALIEGSYGKRRYFTELLKAANLDAGTSRRVLEQAGREIGSDYELATLLIAAADKLLVDDATRKAYFDAARTIASDYEMRRVLGTALKRGPASPAQLAGVLDATRDIESDYEAASLLIDIAKRHTLDAETRAPFFAALGGISSDHEKGRVLSAFVSRDDLSEELTVSVIEAAATISSDYEAASVLQRIARRGRLEGTTRAAFLTAVDTIGSEYEKGRALQALTAGEPRKTSR